MTAQPDTGTDRVAAYLVEARKRIALVSSPAVEPIPVPGDDAGNARLQLWYEDVPRLLAVVEAVLVKHPKAGDWCDGCDRAWPCPTYRAISRALPVREFTG